MTTLLRHYILSGSRGAVTACGLIKLPGENASTWLLQDTTCPECRAALIDLQLTRESLHRVGRGPLL